jgi:hypothetical protein
MYKLISVDHETTRRGPKTGVGGGGRTPVFGNSSKFREVLNLLMRQSVIQSAKDDDTRKFNQDRQMKKLISAKLAGNILLASLGLLFIFHVLVLFRVLPADIVWGGQVGDAQANLVPLEIVALFVTLLFMFIVAVKTGHIKLNKFSGSINTGVWLFFIFMVLNTLGNLASAVSFENLLFAPITLILAFCALRLAIEK